MNAESADHFNIQPYFNNLDDHPISTYIACMIMRKCVEIYRYYSFI